MNSTVRFARLFGDAQGSTDVSKRLAFTQCDFSFTQFTEDLFDGVTKTCHAGLLSARSYFKEARSLPQLHKYSLVCILPVACFRRLPPIPLPSMNLLWALLGYTLPQQSETELTWNHLSPGQKSCMPSTRLAC